MKESLATRRAKACLQGADNAPTVRLPVQRFSSSKILVLARVALYLTIRSCLPFSL